MKIAHDADDVPVVIDNPEAVLDIPLISPEDDDENVVDDGGN